LEESGYYGDAAHALAFANRVSRNCAPFGRGSQEAYMFFRRRAQLGAELAPWDKRFDGWLRRAQEHVDGSPERLANIQIVQAHRSLRQLSLEGVRRAYEMLAPVVNTFTQSLYQNDSLTIPTGLTHAHVAEISLLASIAACRLRPGDWKQHTEQTIESATRLMHLSGHVLPTEYTKFISDATQNNHARAARMLRLKPSQFRAPVRDDARANIAAILQCLARIRLLEARRG
jgi:hypothetical protein